MVLPTGTATEAATRYRKRWRSDEAMYPKHKEVAYFVNEEVDGQHEVGDGKVHGYDSFGQLRKSRDGSWNINAVISHCMRTFVCLPSTCRSSCFG